MHRVYCYCFQNGIVPKIWLRKVYSSILNSKLSAYLEENNILVDEQNGFRKSRSCEDHAFVLSSIIDYRKSEGSSTYAAFIDLSKAFDCINRTLLCYKLLTNKINGQFYHAVLALYRETESCVQVNNMTTEWFGTLQGVRQGDNLSPTLFNIYLNDLAKEIKDMGLGVPLDDINVPILLYADDIVLISENESNLQKMLDHVEFWCQKW